MDGFNIGDEIIADGWDGPETITGFETVNNRNFARFGCGGFWILSSLKHFTPGAPDAK